MSETRNTSQKPNNDAQTVKQTSNSPATEPIVKPEPQQAKPLTDPIVKP
jgi:hypothetical protein